VSKLNYIADIIEEFDIVFFTETHLDNQVLDSDIIIEGFETPSRKNRVKWDNRVCTSEPGIHFIRYLIVKRLESQMISKDLGASKL
jgi:hypothetical protein